MEHACRRDKTVQICRIGKVGNDGLMSIAPQCLVGGGQPVRVPAGDDQFSALLGAGNGNLPAYAGRSAGDENSLARQREGIGDRKSTRLNSSHSQISYAVFCLKKKKNINHDLASS